MLFNSLHFVLFFPVVFLVYWALPGRFRVCFILASSYYFYMSWNAKYIVLILFTTVISYYAAILTEKFQRTRRLILIITLLACLGVLFVFKYFNFFTEALTEFFSLFAIKMHPVTLKLSLPVGISFYTFQTLSYVIDVYKGNVKAEHNFCAYAAFVSFFPQLVAGPIERTSNLLPQIKAHHEFDYTSAICGARLMLFGFYKKLAIADIAALYVDKVFENVYQYEGSTLLFAVFLFTVQIYCDFSGYSDIARGCAKLFGINLMENFRSPYFSASIKEFWSRWHISLSTWFRDYIYIPLGGNRCGKLRNYMNLMVTFIISGLWHGANWTFILWGAVHGIAQVIEKIFVKNYQPRGINWALRVLLAFTFCMFAWVFFRSDSLEESIYVLSHVFRNFCEYPDIDFSRNKLLFCITAVLIAAIHDYFVLHNNGPYVHSKFAVVSIDYLLTTFIFLSFLAGVKFNQFVYFQF